MSKDETAPRSRQEIAQQSPDEKDPQKVVNLADELIRALDEESSKRMDKIRPTEKASGAA